MAQKRIDTAPLEYREKALKKDISYLSDALHTVREELDRARVHNANLELANHGINPGDKVIVTTKSYTGGRSETMFYMGHEPSRFGGGVRPLLHAVKKDGTPHRRSTTVYNPVLERIDD